MSLEGCTKLTELSVKFSQALGAATSGSGAPDLQATAKAYEEFADEVPEEIRDAFRTIAAAFGTYADVLGDIDMSSGKTPDAKTLQKLAEAAKSLDNTKLTAASAEIEAWAKKNCTRAGSDSRTSWHRLAASAVGSRLAAPRERERLLGLVNPLDGSGGACAGGSPLSCVRGIDVGNLGCSDVFQAGEPGVELGLNGGGRADVAKVAEHLLSEVFKVERVGCGALRLCPLTDHICPLVELCFRQTVVRARAAAAGGKSGQSDDSGDPRQGHGL